MAAPQSPIQIHIRDFGAETTIPMAYPPETTEDEIRTVARRLLDEGKVMEARVVDTRTGRTLWTGCWELTTSQLGG